MVAVVYLLVIEAVRRAIKKVARALQQMKPAKADMKRTA